jgi:succinate dehydrogenase / fumarate reductase, cytochrome b subunit
MATAHRPALNTSIGRKLVMALSGLFMILFLFVHIGGNFALFNSDYGKFFNQYSEFMSHNPIIQVIQWVLFGAILLHIYLAARLTAQNNAARPVKYAANNRAANSTWISRNMGITGTVIALFLVAHLYTFWYRYHNGAPRWISYDGGKTWYKDMYNMVEAAFTNQSTESVLYASFYLVALAFLFGHLGHGIQSSARTTGISQKGYTPISKQIGLGLTAFFAFGFATMPIAFMTGLKTQFPTEAGIKLTDKEGQVARPDGVKKEENGGPQIIVIVPEGPDHKPDVEKAREPYMRILR